MSQTDSNSTTRSLDQIVASLSPETYYQAPGGRRTLLSLVMISGLPSRSRVIDVQCGIGSASVDLAEAFDATVIAFDDYAPYLAFGKQQASSRNVGKRVDFRAIDGESAADSIDPGSAQIVLGLGGGLSDTLPGRLEGGLNAAWSWLVSGGVVILGDLVTPGEPSQLMQIVFGSSLMSEASYLEAVADVGFELILANRSSAADWAQMGETMQRLRDRKLDLGPEDERQRQRLTEAARTHPEIAYLNLVARKR